MVKNTKTKEQRMLDTKLTSVMRYDKGLVGTEVEETEEGYIKGRAIVTRCGVFFYKNADGSTRAELRHPDDVSVPESLESIKMIPVVDGHPTERLVNAENSKKLSVGYTGEVVENEYPYVIANMVITDKNTVEKIKQKQRNQLSLGYTVDLLPESGMYNGEPYEFRQTNIRYNHLALVDEARAGPQARIALDGMDAENVEINKIGVENMATKRQRKVKIDNVEYMLDDDVGGSVDKMIEEKNGLLKQKDALEARIEELENELDKAHAERDSLRDKDEHPPKEVHEPLSEKPEMDEIGSNGKEVPERSLSDQEPRTKMEAHTVTEPQGKHYPKDLPHVSKVDSADVQQLVRARVRLETLGNKYLDKQTKMRMDSMSDLDVKKKLILSFQPNAHLDGKSETYINARFDSVLETLPAEKVIAAPSRHDSVRRDNADSASARAAMIQKQQNAWKQTNLRGR